MTPRPTEKYAARFGELQSLSAELTHGKRGPGDGAVVGRVLEAAGDLLRRTRALSPDVPAVHRALATLSEAGLKAWSAGVAVAELGGKLERAAGQAVESALPDTPEDGELLAGWALADLQARDRLESALCALEHLAGSGRPDAAAILGPMRRAATRVDARARAHIASFTALNALRRLEGALLDEPAAAWWFSERCHIDDDHLVQVLGGEKSGTLSPEERDVSELVRHPRRRRISSDDLLRLDLGLASSGERAFTEAEAASDAELRLALEAMRAGEEAILELERGAPQPPLRPDPSQDAPTTRVVETRPEFKVVVLRTPRSVQVVVQPRSTGRLAASLIRSDEPDSELRPRRDAHEWSFELGHPGLLDGVGARLVVTLGDDAPRTVEIPAEALV